MKTSPEKKPQPKQPARPSVPRDPDVDTADRRSDSPSAAADINPPDEHYTDRDKPLVAGSREARALHDNPPPVKGELDVGTAGDAARASKTGIHGKPIPPRGQM